MSTIRSHEGVGGGGGGGGGEGGGGRGVSRALPCCSVPSCHRQSDLYRPRAALCHSVTASQTCTVHVLLCAILSPPCCSVPFCHRQSDLYRPLRDGGHLSNVDGVVVVVRHACPVGRTSPEPRAIHKWRAAAEGGTRRAPPATVEKARAHRRRHPRCRCLTLSPRSCPAPRADAGAGPCAKPTCASTSMFSDTCRRAHRRACAARARRRLPARAPRAAQSGGVRRARGRVGCASAPAALLFPSPVHTCLADLLKPRETARPFPSAPARQSSSATLSTRARCRHKSSAGPGSAACYACEAITTTRR